jgi:hypothetical protein
VGLIDIEVEQDDNLEDSRNTLHPGHTPVDDPSTGVTSQEAKLDDDDNGVPDLADNDGDESDDEMEDTSVDNEDDDPLEEILQADSDSAEETAKDMETAAQQAEVR